MRIFLYIFLFISLNSFADKVIIHNIKTGDSENTVKVYISNDYLKIENSMLSMTIYRNEQYIQLLFHTGEVSWQGKFDDFNKGYKDYAEILAHNTNETISDKQMNDIYSNIDSSLMIINTDTFVKTLSQITYKKAFMKKSVLEYKCIVMKVKQDSKPIGNILLTGDITRNSIIEIHLAMSVFNKFNAIFDFTTLKSFDYLNSLKYYAYPMKFVDNNNYSEEVIAIEDKNLGSQDFNMNKNYPQVSLPNLIEVIQTTKDRN